MSCHLCFDLHVFFLFELHNSTTNCISLIQPYTLLERLFVVIIVYHNIASTNMYPGIDKAALVEGLQAKLIEIILDKLYSDLVSI